jgi:hypothetical protein
MKSSIEWYANEVLNAIDLHSQGKITPTSCVAQIIQAKYASILIHKEEIEQAHYNGGIDFQMKKESYNQEVPYKNDAEDYYKKNY